jgi:FkbM family methyltransferase
MFKAFLRLLLLSRKRRDSWLDKAWVGAFDLPTFMPDLISRFYRLKCWSVLLSKWYDEPRVSECMSKVGGELYVDVGASFGHYLRRLSTNFDRMIGIEADPSVFRFLVENMPANCLAINVAVADKNGVAKFHAPLGQYNFGVGSLLPAEQRKSWIKPISYKTFSVKTATLDTLLSTERHIDLVKVDVEGAEELVLFGASHVMQKIARWIIEIHNPLEHKRIVQMMIGYGYRTKQLDNDHYLFERGDRSMPN